MMSKSAVVSIDTQIHQAIQFKEILVGERQGELDFRALKKGSPTVKFRSSDKKWSDLFNTLNGKGYEIFACINQTDGHGQKKENIQSVRALVIDIDDTSITQVVLNSLPVSPTAVVSSSPGKCHIYYRVINCPLDKFSTLQRFLASKLGGDPAVSDLSRVMRVPGSYNRKSDNDYFVSIVEHEGEEYTVQEIIDAFGFGSFDSGNDTVSGNNFDAKEDRSISQNIVNILQGVQLHDSSISLASQLRFKNLHETEISRTLRELYRASDAKRDQRFTDRENDIVRITLDACRFVDQKRIENQKTHGSIDHDDTEGWGKPEYLQQSMLPVDKIPLNVLPDCLNSLAEDEAARIGCPLDFVVISLMVCAASFIARDYIIQPKVADDGWQVCPNIWGILIGAPSAKKSPSMNLATGTVWSVQKQLNETFDNELKEHEVSEELNAIQESANKSQVKKLLKQGNRSEAEAILRADKDESGDVVHQRVILGDCTTEKAGEILSENPKGLLLVRDELSGWLKTLEKSDRANDRSFYLESFNGLNSYVYDRIGRGTVIIPTLRISMLGGIQPEILKNLVVLPAIDGTNGDGLLQRFQLAIFPDIKSGRNQVDRVPNQAAKKRFTMLLSNLMEVPHVA